MSDHISIGINMSNNGICEAILTYSANKFYASLDGSIIELKVLPVKSKVPPTVHQCATASCHHCIWFFQALLKSSCIVSTEETHTGRHLRFARVVIISCSSKLKKKKKIMRMSFFTPVMKSSDVSYFQDYMSVGYFSWKYEHWFRLHMYDSTLWKLQTEMRSLKTKIFGKMWYAMHSFSAWWQTTTCSNPCDI